MTQMAMMQRILAGDGRIETETTPSSALPPSLAPHVHPFPPVKGVRIMCYLETPATYDGSVVAKTEKIFKIFI